jgi:hypothetical protein
MFKLKTIAPEEATGLVADAYQSFPPELGVPNAFRMMSASVRSLELRLTQMGFWKNHPTFDSLSQSAIRYLFTDGPELAGCREANSTMLAMAGLTATQIDSLRSDVSSWPLGEKNNALVHFVVRSLKDKRPADTAELDSLRDLGWSDPEIFEALDYGAMVMGTTTMVAILKK